LAELFEIEILDDVSPVLRDQDAVRVSDSQASTSSLLPLRLSSRI